MKHGQVDAYIILRTDEHMSEWLAPCDERLAFISEFTGSNGQAVVTAEKAMLWTDSRYY
jgi:Xaa-Pro aminopeptidase